MEGTDAPPLSPFAFRLIRNENALVRLASLAAYISTMGGGFYHCRYLSTEIVLARRQRLVTLLWGDTNMTWRCRINEGYCYVHCRMPTRGKGVICRMLGDMMV